jgi:phosphate starvation-inducible PhoH-like protein
MVQLFIYHDFLRNDTHYAARLQFVNTLSVMSRSTIRRFTLSRKKSSALRKEQDYSTQKHYQTFYQKQPMETTSNIVSFNPQKQRKAVNLVPKTVNQESYILALQNEATDVVVVSGPAGTGKTYLAILAAIQAMRNRECDRIVLCRPNVSIEDEQHGFLPGDLNQKLAPWVRPMVDVLHEFYAVKEVEGMLADQIVEFAPLGYMRGRTFKNTWIIADEMQNATPTQLKMLLTRIGVDSKIVVTGDIEQTDRKSIDNGLMDLQDKLQKSPTEGIETCYFDSRDIQRHRLIGEILKLYR